MIQLSFTKDLQTPNAIYFDDEKPEEYSWHFFYKYLSDDEALALLDDDCVSPTVKQVILEVLK
jgi:hypothetical protein